MKYAIIPINFSHEIAAMLKEKAQAEGLATAAFLRHLILTHPKLRTYGTKTKPKK